MNNRTDPYLGGTLGGTGCLCGFFSAAGGRWWVMRAPERACFRLQEDGATAGSPLRKLGSSRWLNLIPRGDSEFSALCVERSLGLLRVPAGAWKQFSRQTAATDNAPQERHGWSKAEADHPARVAVQGGGCKHMFANASPIREAMGVSAPSPRASQVAKPRGRLGAHSRSSGEITPAPTAGPPCMPP